MIGNNAEIIIKFEKLFNKLDTILPKLDKKGPKLIQKIKYEQARQITILMLH